MTAFIAAVIICVVYLWLRYVYNEVARPMTTTEWRERMQKLGLGVK